MSKKGTQVVAQEAAGHGSIEFQSRRREKKADIGDRGCKVREYLEVRSRSWEWQLVLGRQGSSQVRHAQLPLPLAHRLPTPNDSQPLKGETLGV
jgi:hypothetical protein